MRTQGKAHGPVPPPYELGGHTEPGGGGCEGRLKSVLRPPQKGRESMIDSIAKGRLRPHATMDKFHVEGNLAEN